MTIKEPLWGSFNVKVIIILNGLPRMRSSVSYHSWSARRIFTASICRPVALELCYTLKAQEKGLTGPLKSSSYAEIEQAVIQGKLERNPCKGSIIKEMRRKKSVDFTASEDITNFLHAAREF